MDDAEHLVKFEMEVWAETPKDAARMAAKMLADDGYAHRAVYDVTGPDGATAEVDLGIEE